MSMMQVRWTLNGGTPSKRKTLACDYNPIQKRLRDFGHEGMTLADFCADRAYANFIPYTNDCCAHTDRSKLRRAYS